MGPRCFGFLLLLVCRVLAVSLIATPPDGSAGHDDCSEQTCACGGQLHQSIENFKRLHVLFRRLSGARCDPLDGLNDLQKSV
ncbi:hypothetical protein ABZT47_28745 [Sphaerisporangium sp. NPDC005289]|uniref:hypothetical protein n=1 Tax=Sphaerisporangium sp. NPDC005289 TaxID=3155247 RepID=UPI0033BD779F